MNIIDECKRLFSAADKKTKAETFAYLLDIIDNKTLLNLYFFLKRVA